MVSPTKRAAAKAAGISESTLRTYMGNEEFSAAYRQATADVVSDATRQLQLSLSAAIDRLVQIVADDRENSMAAITAARTLLDFALKFSEFNDILKLLEERNAL